MATALANSGKRSPRCDPWDYVATDQEYSELEDLKSLRAAITQSKKEFKEGQGILITPEFFDCFKK